MRLSFESNSSTGRFAVLDENAPRYLLFESYHLDANERLALANAFRHIEEKAYGQGLSIGIAGSVL